MLSYATYAECQVIECEKELVSDHEYRPAKHISCAIAAYGHMRSCLRFAQRLADSIDINISSYDNWAKEMISKRDRTQAHPDEYKGDPTIITHSSIIDGVDKIRFPLWSQKLSKIENRIDVLLTPRKDLGKLAELIEFISEKVMAKYAHELCSVQDANV